MTKKHKKKAVLPFSPDSVFAILRTGRKENAFCSYFAANCDSKALLKHYLIYVFPTHCNTRLRSVILKTGFNEFEFVPNLQPIEIQHRFCVQNAIFNSHALNFDRFSERGSRIGS